MHTWCTVEVPLWHGFSHSPWHSANSSASASTGCKSRLNWSKFLSLVRSPTCARIPWGSCGLWFPVCKTFAIYHDIKIQEIIQSIQPVFGRNCLYHRSEPCRPCKIGKYLCPARKSCWLLPTNGVRNIRLAMTCCLKEVIKSTVVLWRCTPSQQLSTR